MLSRHGAAAEKLSRFRIQDFVPNFVRRSVLNTAFTSCTKIEKPLPAIFFLSFFNPINVPYACCEVPPLQFPLVMQQPNTAPFMSLAATHASNSLDCAAITRLLLRKAIFYVVFTPRIRTDSLQRQILSLCPA